ncbi:Uncharacterised protein [Legionella beliardensis]|uniref:Uncharacterized protein n=1 Tax=Legionella beliardensis TaxID=91822 RepID=A0A378HZ05_9GAMM|nr:hypothetical protein [Legionella beliardensis]STX28158.1 Uncharacterised protein [Legionella beliardensis]
MPSKLILNKRDEFFLALGKQERHSFLMLGVVKDGNPILLARVGKTNDIDPDVESELKMTMKYLSSQTLARIADEGIARQHAHETAIAYQAYAINYNQTKEFIEIIAAIEKKQWANPNFVNALQRIYKTQKEIASQAIEAYVPIETSNRANLKSHEIVFKYKKLKECTFPPTIEQPVNLRSKNNIFVDTNQIHAGNTCRHSAVNIIEVILGFKTNISKQFFIPLRYKTKLKGGVPDKTSFYILPPPPTVYNDLTHDQTRVLNKIYKRLEEIPQLNCTSAKTRIKFDELKNLYKDIAGSSSLNATQLLEHIVNFLDQKEAILFQKRANRFISFFTPVSSTEKMFNRITNKLVLKELTEAEESTKFIPTN